MIHISHILCPIDFSEASRHALAQAGAIAKWYEANLTLLYVFVNRPAMDLPPLVLQEPDRYRLLAELREFAESTIPGRRVSLQIEEAECADREILEQAERLDTDLLVLGTHGRSGFRHLFLGSVTEKVIRRAACPTLVVPPRAPGAAANRPVTFRRILCPVDFSASSLAALSEALDLAREAGAHLQLLHVVELPPVVTHPPEEYDIARVRELAIAASMQRLQELVPDRARGYCAVDASVVEGRAYREILRVAATNQSDLIVVGVHGRGVTDLLLFGSTTHHVIRAAICPVLVVRSVNGVTAALSEWRAERARGSFGTHPL